MIARRIFRWSLVGAVGFAISSCGSQSGSMALSIFIGIVTGAVAGAVASIAAHAFVQAIITGAAAGVCGSLLGYYLLGASRSLGSYVGIHTFAVIVAFLIFRVGLGERRAEPMFASPQKT
jgi:hypothetical protein